MAINSKVTLAVQEIEDEVFWKAIYVLLHKVFPALKALHYCDSNTPSMDKIHHLAKRAEDAILKLVNELDDEKIIGDSGSVVITGYDEEVEEIFGSYKESECDDDKRCFFE